MIIPIVLTVFIIALLFGLCSSTEKLLNTRQQLREEGNDIIIYL